jgi:hypothetical protein
MKGGWHFGHDEKILVPGSLVEVVVILKKRTNEVNCFFQKRDSAQVQTGAPAGARF